MDVDVFITRWIGAAVSERAHYQSFIVQLCRLLGVPAPDEDRPGDQDYRFERAVRFRHEDGGSHVGFIDCYRRDCFVLEAKQSDRKSGERLMRQAKRQAETYAKGLDEWPPFLMLVDVGRSIELWSDFARQGKAYVPFPDRARHRIRLQDLRDPAVRAMLARVWTDPGSLDPARVSADVTTGIGVRLARLVRSIEGRAPIGSDGRLDPVHRDAWNARTATFVTQCIFAMFADSVGLIEQRGFLEFLKSYRGQARHFHKGAGDFFRRMDEGGHCAAIRQDLRRFNGGLFRQDAAVEITEEELEALIEAAGKRWDFVEPAIFGALLEQALDPRQRAELGAHYTPRPYVEELLQATVMEPLRADWEVVEALAIDLFLKREFRAARETVREFHRILCAVRVLDPACGTGNFLYVCMHLMKELETEVLSVLAELGEERLPLDMDGSMVGPAQFRGMEKSARAAGIAEMVMWIGHLQWHFRTHGRAQPSEPILRNFKTIQVMDALLCCDPSLPASSVTITAPRRPDWPSAHFIVGNPPFLGAKDQRRELGDSYVDALWAVREGRFRSADLVAAWWDRAGEILTAKGSILRRFGLITTNSITQTFSRRVLEHHLERQAAGEPAMRLVFAIPDHPWVEGTGTAAVRVSMTVAERGAPDGQGRLRTIVSEDGPDPSGLDRETPRLTYRERRGVISANLTVGSDVTAAVPLRANAAIASRGVQLMGAGFIVDAETALRLGSASAPDAPSPFRAYRNGRDLADQPRDVRVIDLHGWDEPAVRRLHPGVYQHLLETVKPDRDLNNRAAYREAWWTFGEPRQELRAALEGLPRYIVTVETAKHRWFRFLPAEILPDNRLVCIATDDPFVLAVLSSRIHGAWARATGGLLEDRPVYAKSACFDRFPFPEATAAQREELSVLAEDLDHLRGDVLRRHPELTMTGLYNARDRLRSGGPASAGERRLHELGCIGLLDHLHTRIDAAVMAAYGWPHDVGEEAVAGRLAALNRQRSAEEGQGRIRYLRPAFQSHRGRRGAVVDTTPVLPAASGPRPDLPRQDGEMASVLLDQLRRAGRPLQPGRLAAGFRVRSERQATTRIERILGVLAVAGSVHRTRDGWFAPRRLD
jgi:hypothetical protein